MAQVDCRDDVAKLYTHPNQIVYCILTNQLSGSGDLGNLEANDEKTDNLTLVPGFTRFKKMKIYF